MLTVGTSITFRILICDFGIRLINYLALLVGTPAVFEINYSLEVKYSSVSQYVNSEYQTHTNSKIMSVEVHIILIHE